MYCLFFRYSNIKKVMIQHFSGNEILMSELRRNVEMSKSLMFTDITIFQIINKKM